MVVGGGGGRRGFTREGSDVSEATCAPLKHDISQHEPKTHWRKLLRLAE